MASIEERGASFADADSGLDVHQDAQALLTAIHAPESCETAQRDMATKLSNTTSRKEENDA